MPSFCVPFGLLPKPAITRPRTGQRNDGIAPLGSAVLTAGSGFCGWSSFATFAVCTGPRLATFCRGAGRACAACGAEVVCADATAYPPDGMVRRSPTLSLLVV